MAAAQNHKVVLSSHNRMVNAAPSAPADKSQRTSVRTDENGFTIPGHRIVHRGEFDMQNCANALTTQVHSMRPKELLIEIDLPLCQSSNNVDLDVCERSLKLHCDAPKYSLDLALPYPVRESDSHARFDKKQRKLIVTLAVIQEAPVKIDLHEDVEMEQTTEEPVSTSPPLVIKSCHRLKHLRFKLIQPFHSTTNKVSSISPWSYMWRMSIRRLSKSTTTVNMSPFN